MKRSPEALLIDKTGGATAHQQCKQCLDRRDTWCAGACARRADRESGGQDGQPTHPGRSISQVAALLATGLSGTLSALQAMTALAADGALHVNLRLTGLDHAFSIT